MTVSSMALNVNEKWGECQLKPELQIIIGKHFHVFENPHDE